MVLDKTPFYAEGGGQVGDKGLLISASAQVKVIDTKKENDLIIHFTEEIPALIDATHVARIDVRQRFDTQLHHTATHLLHAALRRVLGNHVAQKGSLVNDEYLRFDFSHFTKISLEEMIEVESMVNEKIRQNIPVVIKKMNKEDAIRSGAMALFGEKYGDIVRVVTIDPSYSVELCGGTHVGSTGELGIFKIKSEVAIGSGLRRIEAVAGRRAEVLINDHVQLLNEIREKLKNPKDVGTSIANLISENASLKKQLALYESKNISAIKDKFLQKIEMVNNVQFLAQVAEVPDPGSLKNICFALKKELTNYVVMVAGTVENKLHVVLMIDPEIVTTKNLDASRLIKEIVAPLIEGNGGGQKTLATASGNNLSNFSVIAAQLKELL